MFSQDGDSIFLVSWLWGSARTVFVVELESLQPVQALGKSCSTSVNPFLQIIQLIWKFQLHGHHLYRQQKRFFVVEKSLNSSDVYLRDKKSNWVKWSSGGEYTKWYSKRQLKVLSSTSSGYTRIWTTGKIIALSL